MVVFGLILMALGIIVGLCGLFLSGGDNANILGIEMEVPTVFLVGVAAGATLIWGFSILKYGTKREWAQHKERKQIEELSAKLAAVEAEQAKKDQES